MKGWQRSFQPLMQADLGVEFVDRAEGAAVDGLTFDQGEPDFDQGAAARRRIRRPDPTEGIDHGVNGRQRRRSSRCRASILERWAPAAGSLFAALFVAAVIIEAGLDIGYELPELTQNFATEDYQSTAGFVFILILLSALCFLWFLADLAATMRSLSQGMFASLVPTAGVVFITALVAATTTLLAPLFNIGHSMLEGADPKTTATAYALLTGIALGLLGLAGIAGALLMSAAATVAYRGGLQPRWTVVLVVVGAVVAAIGTWVFFFPILLVVLWVLVTSVRQTIRYRRGVLNPLR